MASPAALPANPPTTAPTAAPTTVPTGPATVPTAAPAAMPPATAPTPTPTGCAPGAPVSGSLFGVPAFAPSTFLVSTICVSCEVVEHDEAEMRGALARTGTRQ